MVTLGEADMAPCHPLRLAPTGVAAASAGVGWRSCNSRGGWCSRLVGGRSGLARGGSKLARSSAGATSGRGGWRNRGGRRRRRADVVDGLDIVVSIAELRGASYSEAIETIRPNIGESEVVVDTRNRDSLGARRFRVATLFNLYLRARRIELGLTSVMKSDYLVADQVLPRSKGRWNGAGPSVTICADHVGRPLLLLGIVTSSINLEPLAAGGVEVSTIIVAVRHVGGYRTKMVIKPLVPVEGDLVACVSLSGLPSTFMTGNTACEVSGMNVQNRTIVPDMADYGDGWARHIRVDEGMPPRILLASNGHVFDVTMGSDAVGSRKQNSEKRKECGDHVCLK